MSITFACSCGRELIAPDEMEGKEVRCGLCGAVHVVPPRPGASWRPHPPTPHPAEFGAERPLPYAQQVFASPEPPQQQWPHPPAAETSHAPQPFAAAIRRSPSGLLPVVLAVLAIGGHVFDCVFLMLTGVICTLLSLAALIVGWVQARKADNPRTAANARLGAILGFFGLVAGILYIALFQAALMARIF